MNYKKWQWWERFQTYSTEFPELGLALDLSPRSVRDAFFAGWSLKSKKNVRRLGRAGKRRVGQPGRETHDGPLLAAKSHADAEIANSPRYRINARKDQRFAAKIHSGAFAVPVGNSRVVCSSASAVRRGPHFVVQARLAIRRKTNSSRFFHHTGPFGSSHALAA